VKGKSLPSSTAVYGDVVGNLSGEMAKESPRHYHHIRMLPAIALDFPSGKAGLFEGVG
jgi:hypothetical protein